MYIYTHIYIYMHIQTYIYIHTYANVYVCLSVVCMYVCMCIDRYRACACEHESGILVLGMFDCRCPRQLHARGGPVQDSKNPETEGNVWSFRFWIPVFDFLVLLGRNLRGIWEMMPGVFWSLFTTGPLNAAGVERDCEL